MAEWDWIGTLASLRERAIPCTLVTVTEATGSSPRDAGARMVVVSMREIYGTIGGGRLEQLAIEEAISSLMDGKQKKRKIPLGAQVGQCCGGVVELFIEPLNLGPVLYLFGAGHVGTSLAQVLDGTSFRIHLIDDRPEWIRSEALPKSVTLFEGHWGTFISDTRWDPLRVFCAVMTHEHAMDQDIIEALLKREGRYIGLIGSEAKWERFRSRLSARGVSEESLARVRCPMGLPIGGKSPREVALSVAAEILQIWNSK